MAITVGGSQITFSDATVQTTAYTGGGGGGGFSGANTNPVSSSAITLTSASAQYQVCQISSFTNSYVTLPNATTMTAGSDPFVIENRSPYGAKLELRNSAGTTVGFIPIGQIALVQLKDKSTSAGLWAVEIVNPQTFFTYNSTSITNTTTTPVANTSSHGIVGLSATTFVRWWFVYSNGTPGAIYLYTQVGTISGSTITFGTIQSSAWISGVFINGGTNVSAKVVRLSDSSFAILAGGYYSYSDACGSSTYSQTYIRVCTVSGTVVTFGTSSGAGLPQGTGANNSNLPSSVIFNGTICRITDTSFALFYNDAINTSYSFPYGYSGAMACQIVSVSGTTMSIGTKVQLSASTYSQVLSACALSSTAVFLCYGQATSTGGSTGRTKIIVVSVAGTSPTFNTPVACESADVNCFSQYYGVYSYNFSDLAVAPSATQVVFNSGYATGEATISGTVPTFDSFAYSQPLYPMFLSTSSKAYAGFYGGNGNFSYLTIATGGFVTNTPVTQVLQTNLSVQSTGQPYPLGAQPTTAFVAYKGGADASVAASTVILGTTT